MATADRHNYEGQICGTSCGMDVEELPRTAYYNRAAETQSMSGRSIMNDLAEYYGTYAQVMVYPYSFGRCVKSNIMLDEDMYYNFSQDMTLHPDVDCCLLAILIANPRGKYYMTNYESSKILCQKITAMAEAKYSRFNKADLQFVAARLCADKDADNPFKALKRTLADVESEAGQLTYIDKSDSEDDRYITVDYSNGLSVIKRKRSRACQLTRNVVKRKAPTEQEGFTPGTFIGPTVTKKSTPAPALTTLAKEDAPKQTFVSLGGLINPKTSSSTVEDEEFNAGTGISKQREEADGCDYESINSESSNEREDYEDGSESDDHKRTRGKSDWELDHEGESYSDSSDD